MNADDVLFYFTGKVSVEGLDTLHLCRARSPITLLLQVAC